MPTIIGTAASEVLTGTAMDDSITAAAGNDTVTGGAGADTIHGGEGNDEINGGDGADTLEGAAGDDRITDTSGGGRYFGGAGNDFLNITPVFVNADIVTVRMEGGDGNDTLRLRAATGQQINATIIGGEGGDEISSFGDALLSIDAGGGDDDVWLAVPSRAGSTITLGAGADRLRFDVNGGPHAYTVTDFQPGAGGDRLEQTLGFTLTGYTSGTNPFASGHYRLVQRGADAVLQRDADAGGTEATFVDVVVFKNTTAAAFVAYNLFDHDPFALPPPPPNRPIGSFASDTIVGSATVDTITGAAGHDSLSGGDGADLMFGDGDANDSIGDDTLFGGAGGDTLDGGRGADQVFGGLDNDSITDSAGANYLRGDEGDDRITGGADFDDINGNMGNDTASGGTGDDWVVGGKDQDLLFGELGADLVYGNLGNDTCDGGDGNDIIRGGQDNDILRGGPGDDYVSGDRGADTVSGGSGADIFHTFGVNGTDRVTDFDLGEGDRVQVDPGTQYTVAQVGADTVITMAEGGTLILVGVQLSGLTPGWIFGA